MYRVRYAKGSAGEYAVLENHHDTHSSCQYNGPVITSGIFSSRSRRPGPTRKTTETRTAGEAREAARAEASYVPETGTATEAPTAATYAAAGQEPASTATETPATARTTAT